jgi:murein DD-endopeptidase MepM/ murein hydrolase activator NlpD
MATQTKFTKEEAERIIRQVAVQEGAEDLADVLVATAIAETGLDNEAPGDGGKSWGLFHEHDNGRGAGYTKEQRQDPHAATKRAIAEFRAMQKKYPGVDPGTLAVNAQRPRADLRDGYIAKVNGIVKDYQANGDPARNATGRAPTNPNQVPRTQGGGQGTSRGYVFPVQGYSEKSVPPHWGSQDKGARGGADIFAKEGTPVLAMAGGRVTRSQHDSGGGNTVEIEGDDGNTYYYAHLQHPSPIKAGQRVGAGVQIGQVGRTGNAITSNAGPHLHIGIGKGIISGFGPTGGVGKDFDATTLLNQALKGGAGYTTVSNTAGTRAPKKTPEQIDQDVQTRVNSDNDVLRRAQRVRDAKKLITGDPGDPANGIEPTIGFQQRLDAADEALTQLRAKYGDRGPDSENPPAFPKTLKPGAQPAFTLPNGEKQYYPWDYTDQAAREQFNRDVSSWSGARKTVQTLRENTSSGEGAAFKQARDNLRMLEEDFDVARRDAEARIRKELTDASKPDTQVVDGNLIDMETGDIIAPIPRDAKPGQTFNVPGVGTFRLNPDGSAEMIEGTAPKETYAPGTGQRTVDTYDADGKPVTRLIGPDGRTISEYPRSPGPGEKPGVRTVDTVDAQGNPVTQLIDDTGRVIQTFPREGKGVTQVTAPKDAEWIVQTDTKGNQVVSKNPNWDPTSRDVTGINQGRVYRVTPDGKATLTDTLTPEERAIYVRGELAKTEGAETESLTALLEMATKLQDQEMKRIETETWNKAREAMSNGASPEDVIGIIQTGTKNADEWTKVLQGYVQQKQAEETARANRVKEGVDIQNADARVREGLYKDLNETRAQRTQAQGEATRALDKGVIGLAHSTNVLSAMAPQIGSEGVRGVGTLGLGVGAEATEPVVKSWEEHKAELQRLQDQMPSVRLANPNVATPNFSLPKPPAGYKAPTSGSDGTSKTVTDLIMDRIGALTGGKGGTPATGGTTGGTTQPPAQGTGGKKSPGYPDQPYTQDTTPGNKGIMGPASTGPTTRVEARDLGGGRAQQFMIDSATGQEAKWGEEYDLEPEKEPAMGGGGGYSRGAKRPAFRAPKPKRRAA